MQQREHFKQLESGFRAAAAAAAAAACSSSSLRHACSLDNATSGLQKDRSEASPWVYVHLVAAALGVPLVICRLRMAAATTPPLEPPAPAEGPPPSDASGAATAASAAAAGRAAETPQDGVLSESGGAVDGGGASQTLSCEGLSPPAGGAAAAAAAAASQGCEDTSSEWLGDQAAAVASWLATERIEGVYKLLVESLLTPTPKTNAGSRLTSLASRASQLPSVQGVVYDPHHYQFLARFYETDKSLVPTTKRFPLRRWGFQKSFRFACDAVSQAWKPGAFDEGEIPPLEETVTRDSQAASSSGCGSASVGLCASPDLIESYALLEYPDLVLPVVKGVSRDKKSRRWAVYYRGQRHYFYDKNCGGCRRAYELALQLRRQQVEEVEISQVCDDLLQQMQQGATQGGAPEARGPCCGPCLRAVVAYLLSDFADFVTEKGQETLGLGAEDAAAAAAAAAAHAAAANHAAGVNPVLEHLALLRECIVQRKLPSQLLPQQQLLLLRQLLLLQLASVKDLLLQTGLWRTILLHANAGQQQQQQQETLGQAKADGAADIGNAAAAAACAASAVEAEAAAAEEESMCVDG
ncbi:hypothetical protein Esti_001196 [Eimeria stiedai]